MNLVNGMIVDGLGHVSLDSGPAAQGGGNLQQAHAQNAIMAGNANIHQGKFETTPDPILILRLSIIGTLQAQPLNKGNIHVEFAFFRVDTCYREERRR